MVKELAKSIREYKKTSIATPILVSMEVVMECIIPFIIAELVNQIKAGCDLGVIVGYGLILIVMAGLSLMFGALAGSTCATASCGLAKNLRKDMFYAIQNYSFENIDKFSTSSLVTRMTTDVSNVQFAYMMIIRTAIRSPLMLIFAFVMAFVMGGRMAFIFLIVAPLLGVGLFLVARKTMPLFKRVFKKYDALNSSIQENVKGIRVVKSFANEELEKEKFEKGNQIFYNVKRHRYFYMGGFEASNRLFDGLMNLLVLVAGALFMINGQIEPADLVAYMLYVGTLITSIRRLVQFAEQFQQGMTGVERFFQVMDADVDIFDEPGAKPLQVKEGAVTFENVSFSYAKDPSKECLKNVNLTVKSGETVGILGGTGTSKTTLVQLIPRLYDATEGRVLVGGADVRDYDMDALRDQVAMVLQKNVLFSGTIKDNLRWGKKDATDEEMVRMCQLAQADSFIQEFPDKYDTYIEQGGSNVSGGQKQRLCIARALLKHPKILILDDSTSAVDTKTDACIRKALREFMPETTKIIIAQRTASVEDADRIVVMDGGSIMAVGSHAELMASNEVYREIYTSQNKAGADE